MAFGSDDKADANRRPALPSEIGLRRRVLLARRKNLRGDAIEKLFRDRSTPTDRP
jgi:hypothetical protein